MFARGFRKLVKGSWVVILEELKISGGMSIPELQERTGISYMGTKDQCEALRKRGYLETWRVPRTKVGRPEVMYRLTAKADELLADEGMGLALGVLEAAEQLFGESSAERLLFQYFQKLRDEWRDEMGKAGNLEEKMRVLCQLRREFGCVCQLRLEEDEIRIEEFHNPLEFLYARHADARSFELKVMEELLGGRVAAREMPAERRREYVVQRRKE